MPRILIAALLVLAVVSAMPAADTMVPEEDVLTEKKALEGVIDDSSDADTKEDVGGDPPSADKNLRDKNSVGMNKLTGTPHYESHTLNGDGTVKVPGYTPAQARLGKGGHYYLGPSRRRIGAGYGRRRRTPVISKRAKKSAKKALAKLMPKGKKFEIKDGNKVKKKSVKETLKKLMHPKAPKVVKTVKVTEKKKTKVAKKVEKAFVKKMVKRVLKEVKPKVKKAEPKVVKKAEPKVVKKAEPKVVKKAEPKVVKKAEPKVVKKAEPYVLQIKVTTGTVRYAESNMSPALTVTGTKGVYKGTFYSGNRKGYSKLNILKPKEDIGEVTDVSFSALGKHAKHSGNGWKVQDMRVKSGSRPWVVFGCLPRWIDSAVDDVPYDSPYGTFISLKPVKKQCKAKFPEAWGPHTKKGCFCKNSGAKGKCGYHGSKYTWCKTRSKCKGAGKGWDKCSNFKAPKSWGPKTKKGCFCKLTGKHGTCGKNGSKYNWCHTRDKCHGAGKGWDKCTPQ